MDRLTELLVAEGAIHVIRLKQKSKTKRKKKIAAAIYEYQADCDGEWGEIYHENKPLCEQSDNVSSELRGRKAIKRNAYCI